ETEQSGQKSHAYSVNDLTAACDRRCHIVCRHEPCTEHQAASAQMCSDILRIKSVSAEQYDKYDKRYNIRSRDAQIDHSHQDQEHRSDHNGDDGCLTDRTTSESKEHVHCVDCFTRL